MDTLIDKYLRSRLTNPLSAEVAMLDCHHYIYEHILVATRPIALKLNMGRPLDKHAK